MEQRELAVLGDVNRPVKLQPLEIIMQYRSQRDALAGQRGNVKQDYFANCLEYDKGRWSRMMSGSLNFPEEAREGYARLAGRCDALQFEAYRLGYKLVPIDPQQEVLLRQQEEINHLRAQVEAMSMGAQSLRS